MKKILVMLLCIALGAILAVGGTVAYLSDTDSDVNVMTMGNVDIAQHEYERVVDENGDPVEGVLGVDFTENYNITRSYKLQPFTQGKPAYPAVNTVNFDPNNNTGWDSFQQLWNGVGAPGSNDLFAPTLKNVVDKFVFVENTGKSNAYYRTVIAIECPEGLSSDMIHINMNANTRFDYNAGMDGVQTFGQAPEVYTVIDGVRYLLHVATYTEILTPGEVSRPSLLQVYLDSKATNADSRLFGDTWEILTFTQAVQAQGFLSADEALKAAFGDITANANPWVGENGASEILHAKVEDAAALKDALTADKSEIIVELTGDVTYDVAAWQNNGLGSEKTNNVIINGNGHTITFNKTNSDWTNIVTNGAKLTILNATVTDSGYNATSGTWNGHDLTFACEVEMNNVVCLSAVALMNDATLKNVTLTDDSTSDAYMIWIRPNGQTVTIENCTIDAKGTDGDDRGIKIDNQYAEGKEKLTTLIVKNTSFKTEKKAAILVKTPAGAKIVLENVDISGVAADTTNAVWVDGDAAQYADKVTVAGGTVIVEP